MKTDKKNKLQWLITFAFIFIALVLMIATSIPSSRKQLRNYFQSDSHEILSTISGDVFGDGTPTKILKTRSQNGLFIEIYKTPAGLAPQLFQKINLPEIKDGHLIVNGEAANLVLDDVNKDMKPEILVPSFDRQLKAHLHIYTYNADQGLFIEMN